MFLFLTRHILGLRDLGIFSVSYLFQREPDILYGSLAIIKPCASHSAL